MYHNINYPNTIFKKVFIIYHLYFIVEETKMCSGLMSMASPMITGRAAMQNKLFGHPYSNLASGCHFVKHFFRISYSPDWP